MRDLLLSAVLLIALCLGFNQASFAVCSEGPANIFTCDTNAPNPDPDGVQQGGNDNNITVNMIPNSAIDTNNTDGIGLGDGNNEVNVTNASIQAENDGIHLGDGNDTVNLIGANITVNVSDALSGGRGILIANIDQSNLFAGGGDGVNTSGDGPATISITNSSVVSQTNDGLCLTSGPDMVTIEQSLLSFGGGGTKSIFFGSGDDTVILKTGAELRGDISCGADFDTIVFEMAVPTNQLAEITALIESKDPAGDSIIINRLFYEWTNCEDLVADLQPGFISPVPTLSQWGLIAMAGLIGVVGFMVMRKKYTSF